MAITVRASTTVVSAGSASTAVGSATPTLPSGTATDDRVFIGACATHQLSVPANWTQVIQSQVGGGTFGAGTGQRWVAIFYRDKDASWSTMPAVVTTASVASPTVAVTSLSLIKGAGESWATPLAVSGSDATSDTSMSVTGSGPIQSVTGGHWWVLFGWPLSPGAMTSPVFSFSGTNQTPLTTNPATAGSTTGNDAYVGGRTIPVVTVASATPSYTSTQGTASTSGIAFLHQAAGTVASSLIVPQINVSNRAVVRASSW